MRHASAKKLVYILNYVHPFDVQHFVHVMALLRTLEDRCGWEVTLLSEKGGVGCQIVHGKEVRYLSRNGKIFRLAKLAIELVRLRRNGYSLVFVRISKPAALISAIIGKALGMRVLYWQSGTIHDWDKGKPFVKRLADMAIYKAIVSLIDRFVTGPESMIDYYEQVLKVPRPKLRLLYNDIDLSRFCPVEYPLRDKYVTKLLIVHRFSPVRQTTLYFPEIIRMLSVAAQNGRIFMITLIGEGPELRLLKQQAQNSMSNIIIKFLGSVPNSQIQRYYAESDLFVMPSYREGFPRVMLEAMAMQLAIVATDAGGTRDIVGPCQLDYIVSRDDPHDFAKRVVELACEPDVRRQIGEENLLRVQRYSTPVVANMYDHELSALL
jgi:glycosyltransferase involved in cell wall biosynthesis